MTLTRLAFTFLSSWVSFLRRSMEKVIMVVEVVDTDEILKQRKKTERERTPKICLARKYQLLLEETMCCFSKRRRFHRRRFWT